MNRPHFLPLALLACFVPAFIIGCGGGGGGSSSPNPTAGPTPTPTTRPTSTPVPTSLPNGCTTSSYQPNYATAVDALQQWPGFPLRVYLPPTDARTRALTIRGFNQWVTATGNRVRYEIVSAAANADITVIFKTYESGTTLGITTTYFYEGQTEIVRAEIELFYYAFDARNDAEQVNESVAAHEFGHALGIGGHSPNDADLMFPTVTGGLEEVTSRDLNTLRTSYCNNFPTRSANTIRKQSGKLLKRVIS